MLNENYKRSVIILSFNKFFIKITKRNKVLLIFYIKKLIIIQLIKNKKMSKHFFKDNVDKLAKIFDKTLDIKKEFTNEELNDVYRSMVELRKFEERAADLYTKGSIAGFCHLYNGQEAIAIGSMKAAKKDDSYITSYRDHALMYACGADPVKIMAELTGREIGCSKGKGGSMHIFDLERKFYGGHGIVGAQTALGTGIAFEMKYNSKPNVCYTYMGDGAANQGQFYESMNMASSWCLPVIYIIENNGYAMGTAVERAVYDANFFNRGLPFGIIGAHVDGMNFFDVYAKIKIAREFCIEKKRPVLLEMKTYRYRGHSMSDPGKYRDKSEIDEYRKIDPIAQMKNYLIENKILTEDECEKIEDEIFKKMNEVARLALEAKEPDDAELYTDVYSHQ